MNAKWYIGILAIALLSLGVHSNAWVSPNQEILVQFNETAIPANQAENTVAAVTSKLQSIGAENIQVTKTFDGNLKITYYSAKDVATVKNFFSEGKHRQLSHTAVNPFKPSSKVPAEGDFALYELNVAEIQSAGETDLGLNGVLVDFKFGSEWYLSPLLVFNGIHSDFILRSSIENDVHHLYRYEALGITSASYKIPEVRAGPFC